MRPGRVRAAPIAAAVLAAMLGAHAARAALPALDLDVELQPDARRFHATAQITAPATDFRFELHDSLRVTAAVADGRPLAPVEAGRAGPYIDWRVTVPAGAASLRIEYGGTLPALDRSLDERGVLRGVGPMASGEGTFLPESAGWYPRPGPRFTYRVSVGVPATQRVVVPGRLAAEILPRGAADAYRATFEFAQPATGIDLMAGPWVVRERWLQRSGGAPVRLRTYFTPELDAVAGLADGYLDDAGRYLARYAEAIGAYPFTEFSVVASPLPTGFAMPTLTYLGAQVLKLPFIRATSLGHEVLHNWWGNGVYVDYASGNWSEGLTTFMADYAYKQDESAAAARAMRLGWLRDFAAIPPADDQTLASFRARTHGAEASVGYGKAAMVFVMLQDLIGEDAFRRGIRSFWSRNRFRIASWRDLEGAFEAAAGRPLGPFFAQWLERPGAPAVRITDAVARREGSATRLTLRLVQSTPAYALRLPVEIRSRDGSSTREIEISRPQDTVSFDVAAMPRDVRLDPDLRVFRLLDRDELPPILREWIVARSPRLVSATDADAARGAAQALAQRLFENAPRAATADALTHGGEPVLLAGLEPDVDAALAHAGLPPRPPGAAPRRCGR
jgi:aminopeptidase N